MKYKVKVYSIWEFGQRKDAAGNPHQEDSLFPSHGKATDEDRLFILCDGMGGHDAGEVASATVCEAMSESVFRNVPDPEGSFTDADLQRAIGDAFDALDGKDSGAVKKMGTTMTFLKLHDQGATIAHMGDSRVYHIRPGRDRDSTEILHVTWDHSLVNDLVKIGELTPEEAAHSRQKNVITRAMQPHMERRPRAEIYHTADIRPGDYFYMCSDGMLEEMSDDNIRFNFSTEEGKSDEEIVARLIQATEENRDNHTAIIVHVMEVSGAAPVKEERTVVEDRRIPRLMAVVEDDGPTAPAGEDTAPSPAPAEAGSPVAGDKEKGRPAPQPNSGSEGPDHDSYEEEEVHGSSLRRWIYWMILLLALLAGLYYVHSQFPKQSSEGGGGGNVSVSDSLRGGAPAKPGEIQPGDTQDATGQSFGTLSTTVPPASATPAAGESGAGGQETAAEFGPTEGMQAISNANLQGQGNAEEEDVAVSNETAITNVSNGAVGKQQKPRFNSGRK